MKIKFSHFAVAVSLLLSGVNYMYAQERPKLRPLNEKKAQTASQGLYPHAKKDRWGYADAEGKFIIRPIFTKVLPMSAKQVGFVAYMNETGEQVWTPIDFKGIYLTEQEFDQVIADYDDRGLAVVRKDGSFGVINHAGDMVVDCVYTTYLDHTPVRLLRTSESDWVVLVRDNSTWGYSLYNWALNEPIVVKADKGYGIISPRTHAVVADFIYESVIEYIPNSVYCLQKGEYKYLYADDKLSVDYEDVIPGPDNLYYVVRYDGLYGVMSHTGKMQAECLYPTYLDRGPAALLNIDSSAGWVVVVKDGSEEGSSVYKFEENEPIIVKADTGYGIISPRNQSIVADYIYDSVLEYIPQSVYCLQKGDEKYPYADDKLSVKYDEVIPGPGYMYYVVRNSDTYGVMSHTSTMLAECSYETYLDRSPAALLRSTSSTDWVVVVKDGSKEGSSVYTFGEKDPIIAKADTGYGIISPRDQSIVAEFVYESVDEHIPGSVYSLKKDGYQYLYADDKLSVKYEDVIPGPDNAYFIVKQNGLYGVMSHTGKMQAECLYSTYLDRGPAYLLRTDSSSDWTVVVKDGSEEGSSVYTFTDKDPVIVKADTGYGIISPRNQSVVADFIYDSVEEHIPGSVYGLQKDGYKYLYADDRLSVKYEEIIPGPGNAYFVVKQNGLYGVMSHTGKMQAECLYSTYLDRGPAALLRKEASTDWVVVIKDGTEDGSSVYVFGENDPIIVKAENGYGIVSPRNQSIVADYVHNSVHEYIPGSVYCLQKGEYKYLYADDRLSVQYEDVIPEAENDYFVVKKADLYGVVDQKGNIVVDIKYNKYLDRGPVLLLQHYSLTNWVVVAKDDTDAGYSVYTFDVDAPVIVKAEKGYGIVSPRNQSIVADFIYDSVEEHIPGSVYGLQKDEYKYLYADDKLSVRYEEVIPGPDNAYFVVRHNGLYGVMSHDGKMLAECIYQTYLDRSPAALLNAESSSEWVAVVKDASEEGSTVYTFKENEPVIVVTETGYGIISPRNQSLVADYVYDSVVEYVPNSVYCLQKGKDKYLYADDKLTVAYEDVIPDVDNDYFLVKLDGLYGVLNQAGNAVVESKYTTYLNRGPALLLRSLSSANCEVVVKDDSQVGYSVYTFDVDDPIIVKAKDGYGIISPRNQSIVADFIYDSVQEFIPGSVYCLQKDSYRYLYADDRLSVKYDEVIVGPGNAYFVVNQHDDYGVISHTGKMLAECIYATYLDRGPAVLLRRTSSAEWVVVVADGTEDGATVYRFADNDAIVVKAESGYGIISPGNQSIVADFIYDSVQEFVPGSIYCLQKDGYKYLYAGDRLSEAYESVVPGEDNAYFVVRKDGLYGVLTPANTLLLPCSQTDAPVLLKDEYTRFYVDSVPLYVKVDELITDTEYDDYLYAGYQNSPADYLLDETLTFGLKKYVSEAICRTYGTPDFERIMGIPQAMQYADTRKFVLLSNDKQNARYLDLETGQLRDAGEVVYHAFPSKDGIPMYASVCRNGKFGIIDIRNKRTVIPFEYDEITPIGNGYVLLCVNVENSQDVYLYNVKDALMVTPKACKLVSLEHAAWNIVTLEQDSRKKVYNMAEHTWMFPEKHVFESFVRLTSKDTLGIDHAAFVKKGSKGALFSLATGERLTDYLFDDVAKELVENKYHLVTVGKKLGLYDLSAKQYLLPCSYERIDSYHKHSNNEYIVVGRDKKYGVYNATKKKLVVQQKYDEVILKGAYAQLKQGNTYKMYSLVNNAFVSIKQQIQYADLLDDGFAVMFTTNESGIYDLYRSRWQFSFGSRTVKDFSMGEFKDLGDNLLFIPSYGVLNYLICKWCVRPNLGWALWADRSGDYIKLTGGIDGESQAIYSLKRDKIIMNYSGSHRMLPLTDAPALKNDYIIFYSFAKDAEGTEHYKSPSWLPWNDAEGGAGLYDVDENSWMFGNESHLDYFGSGLLYVADKGIFDLSLGGWTLHTNAKLDYFKEAGQLYVEEKRADGQPATLYWFDVEARALVPVSESFTMFDYQELKKVMDVEQYAPKSAGVLWKLYDTKNEKYLPYECNRISLMFE